MPRRVIAVSLLFGTGCLVPNPAWSGASTGGGTGTTSVASSSSSGSESGSSTGEDLPPTAFCEALPALPGDAVIVPAGSSLAEIHGAIATAGAGGTVALEPGTYMIG